MHDPMARRPGFVPAAWAGLLHGGAMSDEHGPQDQRPGQGRITRYLAAAVAVVLLLAGLALLYRLLFHG